MTSEKQEYGARTIRPKIHRNLAEFLTAPQVLDDLIAAPDSLTPSETDWDVLIDEARRRGAHVPEVRGVKPGERAALAALAAAAIFNGLLVYVMVRALVRSG